jgi:protein SCO1
MTAPAILAAFALSLCCATVAAGQVTEQLSLPDAPVFDAQATRAGFVTRLAGQGTVIISFSFLDCATVCPISNTILADVDDRIDAGNLPLTIVTLSIDPVNDTPGRLAEAALAMGAGPRWLWLTATPQDTWLLLDSLGLPPGPIEDHDPMFLIGNAATGEFLRVVGVPEPDQLIDLAMGF